MRAYIHSRLTSDHSSEGFAASGPFAPAGTPAVYAPDLSIEPIHIDLQLDVEIPSRTLKAIVTHTLRARASGSKTLRLNGVGFRDVVVSDPDGLHDLTHCYDGNEIVITWGKTFHTMEERRVAISYQVTNPTSGLYFSHPTDDNPKRPIWAGTDHETERARHWLATIDLPDCHPTVSFSIRHDAKLTALANGAPDGEPTKLPDGRVESRYKQHQPCPSYLTCFAVGDFISYDDGKLERKDDSDISFRYFTTKDHKPADLQRAFGRSREMMEWMQGKLGMQFPYAKYWQFAVLGIGGAMENISLVSWEDMFVLDETAASEWEWQVDQINLHEMAHTWFGDTIICRDYAHAWLKESWAVYMETLWLEDRRTREEANWNLWNDAVAYFDEADSRYSRPIMTRSFEASWDMYDRHLYPGGAVRIHTLRNEIGDVAFFRGVMEYVRRYTFKSVETDDFRRTLEDVTGRSLAKYFDQWFMTAGYPKVKVGFNWDAARRIGTFTVEQSHEGAADKNNTTTFQFKTDLGWTIGGKTFTMPIEVTSPRHEFTVRMDSDPEMVRFDPNWRAVHKLEFNPGLPRLKNQITGAVDPTGRILAAQELAKIGSPEAVEAILEAWKAEDFWGTRNALAKALKTAGSLRAVEALAEMVAEETDPMCMESLFRTAGSLRDRKIADALRARVEAGDLPYRAMGAACEMLGDQRTPDTFGLLTSIAGIPVKHAGFANAGAIRGIGNLRSEAAAEWLLAHAPLGQMHERVRPALMGALASIADHVGKAIRARIVETLTDHLRDPQVRVAKAAAGALAQCRAGEAAGAIRALAAPLSNQERLALNRLAKAASRPEDPKVSGLQKQLEEMAEKLRKLEAKLDKPTELKEEPAAAEAASKADGKATAAKAPAKKATAKKAPAKKTASKTGRKK